MITNVQRSLPMSHLMGAFDLEKCVDKKYVIALGTIAGTYASFKYLPPTMNKWAGSIVMLLGTTLYTFGSLSKCLEYISNYFGKEPPTGFAGMWGGGDKGIKPLKLDFGSKESGQRATQKGEGGKKPTETTPSQTKTPTPSVAIPIVTTKESGTIQPGAKIPGKRAGQK